MGRQFAKNQLLSAASQQGWTWTLVDYLGFGPIRPSGLFRRWPMEAYPIGRRHLFLIRSTKVVQAELCGDTKWVLLWWACCCSDLASLESLSFDICCLSSAWPTLSSWIFLKSTSNGGFPFEIWDSPSLERERERERERVFV